LHIRCPLHQIHLVISSRTVHRDYKRLSLRAEGPLVYERACDPASGENYHFRLRGKAIREGIPREPNGRQDCPLAAIVQRHCDERRWREAAALGKSCKAQTDGVKRRFAKRDPVVDICPDAVRDLKSVEEAACPGLIEGESLNDHVGRLIALAELLGEVSRLRRTGSSYFEWYEYLALHQLRCRAVGGQAASRKGPERQSEVDHRQPHLGGVGLVCVPQP